MIFLRPWFLLFCLIPLVFYFFQRSSEMTSGSWKKACDPALLPFLLKNIEGKSQPFLKKYLTVLWIILSVALSGPALKKAPVTTAVPKQGMVVVLDMSPAMDKNALFQAILKIKELLKQKTDPTGFVLTDANAYTVVPISSDNEIIHNTLSDISSEVMPSPGSAPEKGILKAQALLKNAGYISGKILLITAGLPTENTLSETLQKTAYPVWILGLGEKMPHPVLLPDGQFWEKAKGVPVKVSLNPKDLNGATFLKPSLDDKDIRTFLNKTSLSSITPQQSTVERPSDLGGWIVLFCLPFILPLFRSGFLWGLFLFLLITNAEASPFKRTEERLFEKEKEAVTAFEQKDYAKAAAFFKETNAFYNLGNTLAFQGKYQEAVAAYEEALKQNPNNTDAAFNLDYLKKQLQNQQQTPDEKQQDTSSQQQEEKPSAEQENSSSAENQSKNENASSTPAEKEQESADSPQSEKKETDSSETKQDSSKAEKKQDSAETPQQTNEEKEESEESSFQNQEQTEWFNRIQSKPGRLLKYRLYQQYKEQK